MPAATYYPDRMCHSPGTENRGLDPFRHKGAKTSSRRGDPDDPLGTVSWVYPSEFAKADLARAKQEYEKMLADAGLSDDEFRGLAGYIRQQQKYGYTPTDDDLENFVLSMRPQTQSFPGVVDVREYRIFGLTAGAFFTVPGVAEGISIAADFVPVLGEIKVLAESIRGKDTITGADIPTWARVLGVVGVAASHAGTVAKGLRGIAKVVEGAAAALQVRVGIRLMAPLLVLVANMRVVPAEALRVIDRLEQVDTVVMSAAEVEANGSRDALALSATQTEALSEASSLLRVDELAEMERASSKIAAASKGLPDLPMGGSVAGTVEGIVAEDPGSKRRTRTRKKATRPRPDPTRLFNRGIRKGRAAYKSLVRKGLRVREITDKLKKTLPYKYQMQITGKSGEYVAKGADGAQLQIDGVADSASSPGRVDLIEAKFGFVEDIEKSGHLTFGGQKIDQLERLAKFAAANPDEVGRVVVVVGNLKDAASAMNVVGEVYLNLREALPEALRELVEIVDEDFKPL